MKFRFPGWGIGWFTALFVVIAPIVAYSSYTEGGQLSTFFTVFWSVIGILALLTWFQQRWAAYPLIGLFLIGLLGLSASVVKVGFTWKALGKGVCGLVSIWELWEWSLADPYPDFELDQTKSDDSIANHDDDEFF